MWQLGIVLSTLKRLLESLRPKVEAQMKHWIVGVPVDGSDGKAAFGDRFAEVTVELRAKYKNTLSAIIHKLAQNVSGRPQRASKWATMSLSSSKTTVCLPTVRSVGSNDRERALDDYPVSGTGPLCWLSWTNLCCLVHSPNS